MRTSALAAAVALSDEKERRDPIPPCCKLGEYLQNRSTFEEVSLSLNNDKGNRGRLAGRHEHWERTNRKVKRSNRALRPRGKSKERDPETTRKMPHYTPLTSSSSRANAFKGAARVK